MAPPAQKKLTNVEIAALLSNVIKMSTTNVSSCLFLVFSQTFSNRKSPKATAGHYN